MKEKEILLLEIEKKYFIFIFLFGSVLSLIERYFFVESQFYIGTYIVVIAMAIMSVRYEIYNNIIGINRYEINRMVYWVRALRKFPQRIYYRILDEKYVQIHLTNDVPFREQIALRLLGWPKDYFWNRWEYVVPQENFIEVTKIFKNLQGDMVEKYGY